MGCLVHLMVSQEGIERKIDSTQNHERLGHYPRLAADHVVTRDRRRCDETHRGSHDRRHGHRDCAHTVGHPCYLFHLATKPIESNELPKKWVIGHLLTIGFSTRNPVAIMWPFKA